MSKFKKRALIVLASVIAVVIALTIISGMGSNPLSNAINTVFSPIQSAVSATCEPVRNFVTYLAEMKHFKEENDSLKSELETLKKESRNQEEYKRENERLKKLLQLTDELADCKTVPAKIVSYEPGNWFHTLIINKGSKDDIKVSDVVITDSGLIGKVSEVGLNWARVSTIFDAGNAVGIKLTRTGDVGIAEGDAQLLKKKRFKLDYVSKDTAVINGDLLETSGLGGIYPPGISVGTVEEIELDNTGELVKAVVKPAVNFDELYEVVVVTYWEPAVYDKEQVMIEYSNISSDYDTGRSNSSLKDYEVYNYEDNYNDEDNEYDDSEHNSTNSAATSAGTPAPERAPAPADEPDEDTDEDYKVWGEDE